MKCPKCGFEQTENNECQSCGIVFSKYDLLKRQNTVTQKKQIAINNEDKGSSHVHRKKANIIFVCFISCILVTLGIVAFINRKNEEKIVDKSIQPEILVTQPPEPVATPMSGIARKLHDKFMPKNEIEKACNATVFIETDWSMGSGFFIDNDCHIITNKHVVRLDRDELNTADIQLKQLEEMIVAEETDIASHEKVLNNYRDMIYREKIEKELEGRKQFLNKLKEKVQNAKMKTRDYADGFVDVTISLIDGSKYVVSYTELSDEYDLALLKIEGDNCPCIKPSIDELQLSQKVFTIGNPVGLKHTVTSGIISGTREYLAKKYVQTDAPINPGNSGGPLLNDNGEVIGVTTMMFTDTEGIGFAIPIDVVMKEFGNSLNN